MEKVNVTYNDEEIELITKLDDGEYADDVILSDDINLEDTLDLTEELSKTIEVHLDDINN